jgi:putative ABC transport system substrate-binding protein
MAEAMDVIVPSGGSTVGPLQRATRTVPIVFARAEDPVGAGLVDSLSRPGGNVTGFMTFEYGASETNSIAYFRIWSESPAAPHR